VALHTVTVTDANSCMATDTITLIIPGGPLPTIIIDNDPLCTGSADAAATVSISSGSLPFTIDWPGTANDTTITSGSTEQGVGLSAQTYTVTVTDMNNCSGVAMVTPIDPPLLTLVTVKTDNVCYEDSLGIVVATPTDAQGAVTYVWSPNNTETSATATGLAGSTTGITYLVTVTDDNGCTATSSNNVLDPELLTVSLASSQPLCYESCDAIININSNGGTLDYSYVWGDGPTTENRDSLCGDNSNSYVVTVTDANGCKETGTIDITRPVEVIALIAEPSDTISESPFLIDFLNGSTGADTYHWDFGDDVTGETSIETDPSYTYINATIKHYTVMLAASQDGN
jgi:hypothetical protein